MSLIQQALEKAGRTVPHSVSPEKRTAPVKPAPEKRIIRDKPKEPIVPQTSLKVSKPVLAVSAVILFLVLFAVSSLIFQSKPESSGRKTSGNFFSLNRQAEFKLTGISVVEGQKFAVIGRDIYQTGDTVAPGVSVKSIGKGSVILDYGTFEKEVDL